MNMIIELFLLIILIIFSIIDIKGKTFPSFVTTAVLFVLAIVNIDNLTFGILAFIFGWFLTDIDFFGGVADLKITTMIGLMLSSLGMMLIMMVLILIYGVIFKVLMFYFKSDYEIPFVPVFLFVYLTLLVVQVI